MHFVLAIDIHIYSIYIYFVYSNKVTKQKHKQLLRLIRPRTFSGNGNRARPRSYIVIATLYRPWQHIQSNNVAFKKKENYSQYFTFSLEAFPGAFSMIMMILDCLKTLVLICITYKQTVLTRGTLLYCQRPDETEMAAEPMISEPEPTSDPSDG